MSNIAKIRIEFPKGCVRHALSVNALDARTREIADKTFIYVGNKQLMCTAFKAEYPNGKKPVLHLTVAAPQQLGNLANEALIVSRERFDNKTVIGSAIAEVMHFAPAADEQQFRKR